MNRVDDPDPASGKAPMDCLRVLQVRIHPCRWIQKPGSQMTCGMFRITLVTGYLPCRYECRHLHTQAHQRAAMFIEVVGVRHAIALNIRAVGILRIGPPVITLGEKVVRAAGAAGTMGSRDRDWSF